MINSTETASLGRPRGCLALHPIAAKLQHQLLQKHGKSVNKEQRNNLLAPCSPSVSGDQDETNCLKLCSVIFNIHPNQKKVFLSASNCNSEYSVYPRVYPISCWRFTVTYKQFPSKERRTQRVETNTKPFP